MKTNKLNILQLMLLALVLFVSTAASAQKVTVALNPPGWGPVGYSQVRYYYLPDVQTYYDISESQFIYYGNGTWIRSAYLPSRYRTYDLYSGYKVVMTDYHGESPYVYYPAYKVKYKKGYHGNGPQKTIGSRPATVVYGKPKPAPKPGNSGHSWGNTHRTTPPGHSGSQGSQGHSNGNSGHSNGGGSKGNSGHGGGKGHK